MEVQKLIVKKIQNTLPTANEWDLKRAKEGLSAVVNRATGNESAMLDVSPSSSAAPGARAKQEEKNVLTRKIGIEPVLPSFLKRKCKYFIL